MSTDKRTAALELSAVGLTAAAHLATWAWPVLHAVVVLTIMLGWAGYIACRCRGDVEARRALGLQRRGLGATLRITLPLALASVALFAAFAWSQGTLSLPWTLALLFLTYPAWGLTQQLLVQGVLVRNLDAVPALQRRPWLIALAAGLLFGLVHWPFPELMVATTLMGAGFALIWLRHRNLWPLGLVHGWGGALFFLWVMGKDPMALTLAGLGV